MSATGSTVVMKDIEMRFGNIRALRDISFSVTPNSVCGLIGPNGAGKTTTLKILAADLRPSSGVAEIMGHRLPGGERFTRPLIGFMPDDCGLYDELSLAEYLEFFAHLNGLASAQRKVAVESAIELTGLQKLRDRRLQGLSRGENQRVLLARTLIHDPDLFLLDEPASGLDPRGRVELRMLLRLLHERGKTILISSHILSDLEEICTDFVFIEGGRVTYDGSREELLQEHGRYCSIRIEVSGAVDHALAVLTETQGISVDGHDDRTIELRAPIDPEFSRALLANLVTRDLPVISFERRPETLEQVYLKLTGDDS